MIQAISCPSASDLQGFLLGQSADQESASLEEHLLHCDHCLRVMQALPVDDPLVSALRQGCESSTSTPRSELLERLRLRLRNRGPSSPGEDTAAGDNTGVPVSQPSAMEATEGGSLALAPAQQPDEIGRLAGYRILKELGRGGMGVVYQAEDIKLKRVVALKAMLPNLAADPVARQRFLREAQAMAAVRHDHVVTVFNVDEINGVPFLAMEFLQGMPLDKWLKEGRKPSVAQILRMGREIAEGLAAAHERGLIHRDVKPGNIWLDSAHKGRVKILDFGLARAGTEDVHLTRSGAIVGTPAYMAPEQARAEKVDARSDLFSLGCVLYKLCTGAMPFAGDTTMSLLMALALDHPKPVRELNPGIPAELSDLVTKLLEKDPARRPASARDVVQAIQALERNLARKQDADDRTESLQAAPKPLAAALAAPSRRAPRRRWPMVAAAVVFLALLGGLIAGGAALIHIQTPQGDYVIDTDDPDFFFQVHDGAVKLEDRKNNKTYTLKVVKEDKGAGQYEVEVSDGGDLAFKTKTFTIKRGEKAALTAWFEPKAVAANPAGQVDDAWVKEVAALPPDKQVEAVVAELKKRNPGFDGKLTPGINNGVVTGLGLPTADLSDISPLRALPGLKALRCGVEGRWNRLSDLSPLKGMPLVSLVCYGSPISDLSPLKGMPLTELNLIGAPISDLSPLKGMPLISLDLDGAKISDLAALKGMKLTYLRCDHTEVSDLSPLEGMPLELLRCDGTPVSDLSPLKGLPLTVLICSNTKVRNLAPLEGLPLKNLNVAGRPVSDLSPLKGMPLNVLNLDGTKVTDLSPLKGMPLVALTCDDTPIVDLTPLKGMPLKQLYCNLKLERDTDILRSITSLEMINNKPAAEFWKDLAGKPTFLPLDEAWAKKVRDLPLEKQVEEVAAELKRRNPGFDGKVTPGFRDNFVTRLAIKTNDVADLTPLAALPGLVVLSVDGLDSSKCRLRDLSPIRDLKLSWLTCEGTAVSDLTPLKNMPLTKLVFRNTPVSDLTPLKGMALEMLACAGAPVSDLTPLKGMPLRTLEITRGRVSDLSPLRGLPLTDLACGGMPFSDLSPLEGMKLSSLDCRGTRVSDLSPLRGMPLTILRCTETPISDLAPLAGMKLTVLQCQMTRISDLAPLKGMPLQTLNCDFKPERDGDVLRSIKTLETINDKPAAEFWKDIAAKPTFPPLDEAWAKKVRDLPAEKQVEEVAAELKRRNPDYDGKLSRKIEGGVVTFVVIQTDNVADISPVRALAGLRTVSCSATTRGGPLADLSPLKDMKLTSLDCNYTRVADLSPLKGMPLTDLTCHSTLVADLTPLQGMPLTKLSCYRTGVIDLAPLKGMKLTTLDFNANTISDLSVLQGMPLTNLHCANTKVADLSPLKGMKLTQLDCFHSLVSDLSPLQGMPLATLNCASTKVADLSPLKGMPLTRLDCMHSPVSDLSPLQGMPLAVLHVSSTKVVDLSPLKGMPLTELYCDFRLDRDAEILRSIKTLERVNGKAAADFWKQGGAVASPPIDDDFVQPAIDDAFMQKVAALPADKQVEAVIAELKKRNPDYDGKLSRKIEGGVVTSVIFQTDNVADISPLRAMAGLRTVSCGASTKGGPLADLSPLKDMKLTTLDCNYTKVADLSPLKGMPLTDLSCNTTLVADLTPLQGMPLTKLSCYRTGVIDLAPLKGMKLTSLDIDATTISDLSALQGMPLTYLNCANTKVADLSPLKGMQLMRLDCTHSLVSDLSPLQGMPLTYIGLAGAKVTDLSPLRGMPLKSIHCDFNRERDAEILHSHKTLETINDKPAADFWKGLSDKKP